MGVEVGVGSGSEAGEPHGEHALYNLPSTVWHTKAKGQNSEVR